MTPLNYKRPPGMMQRNIIESFIDPSAILLEGSFAGWFSVIDAGVVVGEHSRVWHNARILAGVRIGNQVSIGGGTEIGRGSVIGDRSRIGANVFLPPNSLIGEGVFIGPCVCFTDDRFPRVPNPGDPPYGALPPVVKDGASIGAGAVILPGITIGCGARIAAGAVVTEDVPDFTMVVGLPARVRGMPESWGIR